MDVALFDDIETQALAMGYAHSRFLAASMPVGWWRSAICLRRTVQRWRLGN
jgi:hypothetical protein